MNKTTIVALATPRGRGAIAIVRLSGENSLFIANKITLNKTLIPRYATLSNLYDENSSLIDEALLIYFKNPKSFTGEDIVEFQLHGGDMVAMRLIDTLIKYGAVPAAAGEFSKRAFFNNKIDLTKAEAIAKLIDTKSKEGAKLLAKQLKGELKSFVDNHKKRLIEILAHSEVMIDYAQEELPDNLIDSLEEKLIILKNELIATLEHSKSRDSLLSGYKVAIIGKPNVGKSSLLNSMLKYERAIVSDIEGTTRDSIEEDIIIGTHTIKIIDTAGIRDSTEVIEKIGIEYSKKIANEADLIIALFDHSREFDKNDREILELLDSLKNKKPIITVINKSDLEKKFHTKNIKSFEYISISCKEKIDILKDKLNFILDNFSDSESQLLISKRQINFVQLCIEAIELSFAPLKSGELEFFSYHINEAIKSISSISQPYEYDQMLDEMFSSFCLGK